MITSRKSAVLVLAIAVFALGAELPADSLKDLPSGAETFLLLPYRELSPEGQREIDDLLHQKEELAEEAEHLNGSFNVDAHESADTFFELGSAHFYTDELAAARDAYQEGLRLAPGSLVAQFHLAQLHYLLGDSRRARTLLDDLSRSGNLRAEAFAVELIASYQLPPPEDVVELPALPGFKLLLVPVGSFPYPILRSIQRRLEEEFRLTVVIDSKPVPLDGVEPGRAKWIPFLTSYRRGLEENNPDSLMARFYREIGVTPADGFSTEELEAIFYAVLRSQERPMASFLANRYGNVDQYEAAELIPLLAERLSLRGDRDKIVGVLGLTDSDLYRDENNYLFAYREGDVAIMSSHRFLTPDASHTQILERLSIQAMTSAVHVLGIPRASRFPCATAYPNSLSEFDLKEDTLCPEVLRSLRGRYLELLREAR